MSLAGFAVAAFAAAALATPAAAQVPPLTNYKLGVTSGWNACYLNYSVGSSVIPNPLWGAGSSIAPDWSKTSPSSFADGNHFLDFKSVLLKDIHGVVTRVPVPAGSCLPGNLVNVRTNANSYPSIQTPAVPLVDASRLIYTTTADNIVNGDLNVYQPRTDKSKITVYFALNYGLRNALDNPYNDTDTTVPLGQRHSYGGYYVSNLTTALLGDASKGLGRAHTAEIKLCFAPMSTVDRKWRKKSGDAVNNKQCLTKMASFAPAPAVTGLAVSDVAYPPNINATTGLAQVSPVRFCRPRSDTTFESGVNPITANANGSDCVMSGQSWKVTKGNNYNLSDPDWYSVDFTFGDNTAKGTYFVRVFAKDINGNYLGFGSSAGSANLTNNNAQNYFKADPFDALHSAGVRGGEFDIQAGAIGCSVMTVTMGVAFFGWEYIRDKRESRRDTTVIPEEKPVAAAEEPAAAPAAAQ